MYPALLAVGFSGVWGGTGAFGYNGSGIQATEDVGSSETSVPMMSETEQSTIGIEVSATETEAPFEVETQAPATETEAPFGIETEALATETEAPVSETRSVFGRKRRGDSTWAPLVVATEVPTLEPEAPAFETSGPASESEAPAFETSGPAFELEAPASETSWPAFGRRGGGDSTWAPFIVVTPTPVAEAPLTQTGTTMAGPEESMTRTGPGLVWTGSPYYKPDRAQMITRSWTA
ncbi:hypothetical protein FGG08_005390 [Glutinoglossum americanum]|uniref:Uncharacterized protein n=1 Tax=Glutinoglossum americanum TaxID=1670608 RepID=A0A9P8I9I0_9PEZI|nr:hypothetical protein FGG08_005390 [Glutinoglossum americanum]